jgi:MoaA/NifB/PqqE/SkfB family radical SAM enzyme
MPEVIPETTNLYRADKALFHADRLRVIQDRGQPYPVHVEVVLSDLCNQDCSFCAYRLEGYSSNELFNDPLATVPRNPNRMLPADKVMQLLDDCKEMGVKAIQLTGGGEPTLHPAFDQVVRGVLDRGMSLAVVTNGTLLHRPSTWLTTTHGISRVALLARASWVRVSLDAAVAENYTRIRRVHPNTFDHVLSNVRLFVAEVARQKSQCRVGFGFVVTPDNYHELSAAIDLAEQLAVDNIRISAAFTPGGFRYHEPYASDVQSTIAREKSIRRRDGFTIYDNFGDRLEDLEKKRPDYDRCPIMQLQTYVAGDGNVYTCCMNAYNRRGQIGSFLENGFKALWDSQHKRELFEGFHAKRCPACMYNPKNRLMNSALDGERISDPDHAAPEHAEFV